MLSAGLQNASVVSLTPSTYILKDVSDNLEATENSSYGDKATPESPYFSNVKCVSVVIVGTATETPQ
jgi:hypothetical protein